MMNASTSSELRFERKLLASEDVPGVIALIRQAPGFFREVHDARQVNNLYLDTVDLADFQDTVAGMSNRSKLRLRWYGERFAGSAPRFEIKFRRQLLVGKVVWHFPRTDLGSPGRWIKQNLAELPAELKTALQFRRPVCFNQYTRHYYASVSGVRVTVDTSLKYGADAGASAPLMRSGGDGVIIEVKYPQDAEALAIRVCGALPYRLSRHSKYRNGILLLRSLGYL
jgi:hypothetical protein